MNNGKSAALFISILVLFLFSFSLRMLSSYAFFLRTCTRVLRTWPPHAETHELICVQLLREGIETRKQLSNKIELSYHVSSVFFIFEE